MDKYWITGWLILDEMQSNMLEVELRAMPGSISKLWQVQERSNRSIYEPSFAHLGGLVDAAEQKVLLECICRFSKSLFSTYDEPDEFVEGDFFISDLDKKEPEMRISLRYGSYAVREVERERVRDL